MKLTELKGILDNLKQHVENRYDYYEKGYNDALEDAKSSIENKWEIEPDEVEVENVSIEGELKVYKMPEGKSGVRNMEEIDVPEYLREVIENRED